MKIISWNVNGIKARDNDGNLKKVVNDEKPDILCIQEVKTPEIPEIPGYTLYGYPSSVKSNYGTAIYTKIKPLSVALGIKDEEFDREGRVIKMEFEDFYLFNVYAPSGAKDKEHLNRKYRFYDIFTKYFEHTNKSVIVCGDLNRISSEIDARRPELMKNISGFMPEEQEWFKDILTRYVDGFRKFYPEEKNYSWWSNNNKRDESGLRFDYFLVSKRFQNKLTDSYIINEQLGSDHAPIVLELNSCPVCGAVNNHDNEFCGYCGIKLIETEEEEEIREDKLEIPKDKIILLDLNYTLIANSKEIKYMPLIKKIENQKYETDLINLIKSNYVILITASPYKRSYKILRDIKEKTGFEPDESFWNFGNRQPPTLKKYWMENEVIPQHGDDGDKYLAIESNPATRRMYKKLGIEARPKGDFI